MKQIDVALFLIKNNGCCMLDICGHRDFCIHCIIPNSDLFCHIHKAADRLSIAKQFIREVML